MVHTMSTKQILSNQDIIFLEKQKLFLNNNSVILEDTGLRATAHYREPFCFETEDAGYWYVNIHVNIPEMLNKNNTTNNDVKQILSTIYTFVSNFTQNPNLFLQRIDYKKDFVLDEKLREIYITQIKKSYEKWGYFLKNTVYSTSVEFKNKSRKLIIYDKNAERKAKKKFPKIYENNALRVEVQLTRKYITNHKRNTGLSDSIENYLSEDMREEFFHKTVAPVVFLGNYYTKEKAFEIIDMSTLRVDKKTGLKEMLDFIEKNSVQEAKESYEVNKFRRYINAFSDLRINPILLPDGLKDDNENSISELPPLFL